MSKQRKQRLSFTVEQRLDYAKEGGIKVKLKIKKKTIFTIYFATYNQ